jgi:hypothetical protein
MKMHDVAVGMGMIVALISGCSFYHPVPNNAQAMEAITNLIGQNGLGLPAGFAPVSVTIKNCVYQEQPDGQVCDVVLISREVPILGAVSIPMQMRFAKRESHWMAFFN